MASAKSRAGKRASTVDGDFRLPPKRRNWKPGTYQLGFFVRFPDGSTVTTISDSASEAKALAAVKLLVRARYPLVAVDLLEALHAEV